MALTSDVETNLNAFAQPQTFPYPMTSNALPYSNALMVKSLAQLYLQSVTDKNEYIERFRPSFPRRRARSEAQCPSPVGVLSKRNGFKRHTGNTKR